MNDGSDAVTLNEVDQSIVHRLTGISAKSACAQIAITVAVGYVALYVVEPPVVRLVVARWGTQSLLIGWLASSVTTTLLVSTAVYGMLRWQGLSLASIGVVNRAIGVQILHGVCFVPLAYAVAVVVRAFVYAYFAVESDFSHFVATDHYMSRLRTASAREVTLAFTIANVVAEGLVFQGILLTRLRVLTGHWLPAIALSGLVCAAAHHGYGIDLVLNAFALSCVWSYIYVRYANLVSPEVAHLLYDCLSVYVLPVMLA